MTNSRGPLFASTELAARIERGAAALCADAARARRAAGDDAVILDVGGGVAVWAGDGSPLNKVAGIGFAGPPDEAGLAAVEEAFAERGSAVQVELASLAAAGWAEALGRRGYALVGFENVLGISVAARASISAPGIDVRVATPDEQDAWLDVVVEGFAHPDAQGVASHEHFPREVIEKALRELTTGAAFVQFIALREGEFAGGASLCLSDDGVAQLAGAATLPAHRRRGVQSALLAARLAYAAERGCDVATITTQPGSRSQENSQRQGFDMLYVRAILVR